MQARRGRWLFLVVLLASVLAFTGLWYLVPAETREVEPDFGGDYVEGITGAPSRVNPLFANENSVDATLSSLVFAGLTRLDEEGVPFPDLAQTWTVSPDGTLYTFTLRPGLLWHDGTRLTADDVVFTYELLQSPELRNPPRLQDRLADAVFASLDSSTVTIALPEPYAPLPAYLTLGILPEHLLRSVEPSDLYDSTFNQNPVGSGPYRLKALSLEHADLVAHPAHHFEQPFIQRLELRFYPDDGALFAALRGGDVNGALFESGLGPSDLLEVQSREDLRMSVLYKATTTLIYLNLDLPIFQDRRLRQALLYAIDRESLIRDVVDGQAVRAQSPILPSSWAYSPTLSRYDAEPDVARLLLQEAGWLPGPDDVRQLQGMQLSFRLITSADPVHVELASRIAQYWNDVGVSVTVESTGLTTLVRDLIQQREYEALLFVSVASVDPDPYDEWHSEQADRGGDNLSLFSDARVDAILEQARGPVPRTRRADLYKEFQEIFAQEVPAIPLYVSTALYVQDAELSGVRIGRLSQPGDRFWQVQEWFLETR